MPKTSSPKSKRPAKPKGKAAAPAAAEKSRFTKDLFQPVPLKEIESASQRGGAIERDTALAIREIFHHIQLHPFLCILADELEPALKLRLPRHREPRRDDVAFLISLIRNLIDGTDDFCWIGVYPDADG